MNETILTLMIFASVVLAGLNAGFDASRILEQDGPGWALFSGLSSCIVIATASIVAIEVVRGHLD